MIEKIANGVWRREAAMAIPSTTMPRLPLTKWAAAPIACGVIFTFSGNRPTRIWPRPGQRQQRQADHPRAPRRKRTPGERSAKQNNHSKQINEAFIPACQGEQTYILEPTGYGPQVVLPRSLM